MIEDITCQYGKKVVAVRNVSLVIKSGEFLTLLGPSGSGKTTILRAIGGYIKPVTGRVIVDDRDITDLPPQLRNIGMVFQNYAIFPHLRVFENIAFGLRIRKIPQDEIRSRVQDALDIVQLVGKEQSYPHELSGGQQQRVALARAIVIEPTVLLMDEPLGALDLNLREAMQDQIRRIQKSLGITTVYVTHDQNEAFAMSDRVALINDGELIQEASPKLLYKQPETIFAAEFIGQINLIYCKVLEWQETRGSVLLEPWNIKTSVTGTQPLDIDKSTYLAIRPEAITVSRESIEGGLAGRVVRARFSGMSSLARIEVGGQELVVLDRHGEFIEGEEVYVAWSPSDAIIVADRKGKHAK